MREAAHGKDGMQLYRQIVLDDTVVGASAVVPAFPGQRFVITNVSGYCPSDNSGDYPIELLLSMQYSGSQVAYFLTPLNGLTTNSYESNANVPASYTLTLGKLCTFPRDVPPPQERLPLTSPLAATESLTPSGG